MQDLDLVSKSLARHQSAIVSIFILLVYKMHYRTSKQQKANSLRTEFRRLLSSFAVLPHLEGASCLLYNLPLKSTWAFVNKLFGLTAGF